MTGRRWSAGLFEKPATPKGAQGKGKKPIKTKDIELADVRKDAVKAAKNPKVQKAANVTACVVASIMAGLCLATGIGIAAVASAATTLAVEPPPVDAPHCATVDPETMEDAMGYGTATGVPATTYSKFNTFDVSFREQYDKYVAAWDSYVADTMGRPQGVRQDCAPMRFPAVGPEFKGVAVVWHGFSSCPQEISLVAPPLAARGYDVLLPLMPGHGNALEYEPEATNWIWGYFVGFVAAISVACCICFRAVASGNADPTSKSVCTPTRFANASLCCCCILFLSALVAVVVTYAQTDAGGVSYCVGLWPPGFSCNGKSEENENLPTDRDGYLTGERRLGRIDEIVALAPGEKVIAGLSGGGAAAMENGQAKKGDGSALYVRQLLWAPYIGLQTFEPILGPADDIGLGGVTIHYGTGCEERSATGKAGYCNIQINNIKGSRDLGKHVLENLNTPPGAEVQLVMVQGDATVMNSKIAEFGDALTAEGTPVTSCVVDGLLNGYHSPTGPWNYPGEPMGWIPQINCDSVNFLAEGTPFPTDGEADIGGGTMAPRCAVGGCSTEEGGCSYDCVADAFFSCPKPVVAASADASADAGIL